MAFVVTDAIMLVAGQNYYGNYHERTNYILHQIYTTSEVGHQLDPHSWPIGAAQTHGLPALLQCTNIVPWGNGTKLIRTCILAFDARPALVNDMTRPWLFQKHMVVRYYFNIMNHVADNAIVGHDVLGKKNKVRHHFAYTKNAVAALLITKCCQGWGMMPSGLISLHAMEDHPVYQQRYYMFVLPIIQFLITEMNPHAHLDARVILEMDMPRIEEYLLKRITKHGIWSQELMLHWIQNGQVQKTKHRHVTKGVEFQFARLLSLIIRDYKWPYNQEHRAPEKLYCLQVEIDHMYQGYDCYTVARYGVPTYHAA